MERSIKSKQVVLKKFNNVLVEVNIKGISPLIVNRFSERSIRAIMETQMGAAKSSKHEPRDPEKEYEESKHKSPLGWEGFPAAGFKGAIVRGAKPVGLVMKDVQGAVFIKADCEETQLVRIYGEPRKKFNIVRLPNGAPDLRFRMEYPNWSAKLSVTYNEGVLSLNQLFQIINSGGSSCGIGEMRPGMGMGKFGYGRFEIQNNN